jgi:serine/threonine protein kinase
LKILTACKVENSRLIGSGNFGRVYKCIDRSVGEKPICLKIVPATMLSLQEKMAVNRLKDINSPYLVKFYDCNECVEENEKFMIIKMEYVNGGELKKFIDSNNLTKSELCLYFRQICFFY